MTRAVLFRLRSGHHW